MLHRLAAVASIVIIFTGVMLLTGCAPRTPAPSAMPRLSPPASDAALIDMPWARSLFSADFSPPINRPADASTPSPWVTRAKFAWNPTHLYLLVESVGPTPDSPFTQHDDELYKADVLELFLDPAGDMRHLYEFQINPRNTTADYSHLWNPPPTYPANAIDFQYVDQHHQFDRAWNCPGLVTHSQLDTLPDGRTRWTAIFAIPMRDLLLQSGLPPTLRPGQSMRVNVLRYAYSQSLSDPKPVLHQFNLVPTMEGCPHISPMASLTITTDP